MLPSGESSKNNVKTVLYTVTENNSLPLCVCVCVRACVRACVCVCVSMHAFVRAYINACIYNKVYYFRRSIIVAHVNKNARLKIPYKCLILVIKLHHGNSQTG